MNKSEARKQLININDLLSCNEAQLISAGFNLLLNADDMLWKMYIQDNPECNQIIHCLSLGKHQLASDTLEKCWKTLTRLYAGCKDIAIAPNLLQDIVSKHLKHTFHSLSRNSSDALTLSVLGFLSSAVLYDSQHANLVFSHCNLAHNIYHYMFSHKSAVRPSIIKFILSFLMTDDFQLIRSLLEIKVVFNNIFRFIRHDPIDLSYFILAVFAKKIFSPEISKKLKISIFSSSSMVNLFHLLGRTDRVSLEDDPITFQLREQGCTAVVIPFCDYVEIFIKTLCTSERFGFCYTPKLDMMQNNKYNNPAILHILKAIPYQLRVGESVERLIIQILYSTPDIVYTFLCDEWYLTRPHIQTEWAHCLRFLIKLYHSLSVQASTEKSIFESALIPLSSFSISALVSPPLTTKLHFNQGILHQNYLCKYLTANLLTCLLTNLTKDKLFPYSDPKSGLYTASLVELIRSKIPDIMTLLSQLRLCTQMTVEQFKIDVDKFGIEVASKYSHLCENIHETFLNLFLNLVLLYQQLFPLSVLQSNYDVSKLLTEYAINCSSQTKLIVLQIVNEAPPGAIKWFDTKTKDSPLRILVTTYLLTESQPARAEIELCLTKFTREMPHLSVSRTAIVLALSIIREMSGMDIFSEVGECWLEMGSLLVKTIEHRQTDTTGSQSADLSFLVQTLENNSRIVRDDFTFMKNFWNHIDKDENEELFCLQFYLFSKLIIRIGLLQENLVKYFTLSFELVYSERINISKYPLSCQVIYINLLDYLATWIQPNTASIRNMKLIKLSIEENFATIKTNPLAVYLKLITALDIQKLIKFRTEFPTDFLIEVLKYIPYGFAQYVINEANTDQSACLQEITAKLDFYDWIIQACTLSNFHLNDSTVVAEYYSNLLSHFEIIITYYFHSDGSELDHQEILDCSEFCLVLMKLGKHLEEKGKLAITSLIELCTSIFIRTSKHFNKAQNDAVIFSTFKWLKQTQNNSIYTQSDAKRTKVQPNLADSIVHSILGLISLLDCNLPKCTVGLYKVLIDCIPTEPIHSITDAINSVIIASTESQLFPKKSKANVLLGSSYVNRFRKIIELNKSSDDYSSKSTEQLLSAYHATLTEDDQNILSIITSREATDPESTSNLKPFVWATGVEAHLQNVAKAKTHLMDVCNVNDVISNLSTDLLNRTIADFPVARSYDEQFRLLSTHDLYDPCFLLPLFSYILSPGEVVECRKFAELGCLGVLFRCMSSLSYDVRASAAHCLERYSSHMTYSSFREKRQISILLDIAANTLNEEIPRIPSIHTSLLARIVPILLHPHHELFLLLTRFLLSKPILNIEELPLFRTMILSSSPLQKREKLWMIKILTEGVLCEEDYTFYRRRHVFPLLFSMCDPRLNDTQICLSISKFALKTCYIPFARKELTSYEGLHAWTISVRAQLKQNSNFQENEAIGECFSEIVMLESIES